MPLCTERAPFAALRASRTDSRAAPVGAARGGGGRAVFRWKHREACLIRDETKPARVPEAGISPTLVRRGPVLATARTTSRLCVVAPGGKREAAPASERQARRQIPLPTGSSSLSVTFRCRSAAYSAPTPRTDTPCHFRSCVVRFSSGCNYSPSRVGAHPVRDPRSNDVPVAHRVGSYRYSPRGG